MHVFVVDANEGSKHICLLCQQAFSRQASLVEHYNRKHQVSFACIGNQHELLIKCKRKSTAILENVARVSVAKKKQVSTKIRQTSVKGDMKPGDEHGVAGNMAKLITVVKNKLENTVEMCNPDNSKLTVEVNDQPELEIDMKHKAQKCVSERESFSVSRLPKNLSVVPLYTEMKCINGMSSVLDSGVEGNKLTLDTQENLGPKVILDLSHSSGVNEKTHGEFIVDVHNVKQSCDDSANSSVDCKSDIHDGSNIKDTPEDTRNDNYGAVARKNPVPNNYSTIPGKLIKVGKVLVKELSSSHNMKIVGKLETVKAMNHPKTVLVQRKNINVEEELLSEPIVKEIDEILFKPVENADQIKLQTKDASDTGKEELVDGPTDESKELTIDFDSEQQSQRSEDQLKEFGNEIHALEPTELSGEMDDQGNEYQDITDTPDVTQNVLADRVITRYSEKANKFNKSVELLGLELNMPDFYFIHRIEPLGQVSESQNASGRDQFVCITCGEKVNWRRSICRHMRDKHQVSLCTGEAATLPEVHDNSGNGKLMKMSEYIKMELSGTVGKRIRGVEKQDMPGIYPCEKCGKMFNRLRNYRKHMITHQAQTELLCTVCVKTFKTADYLRQHMKVHYKERLPYKCTECDFTSIVNAAIHAHRQIHNKNHILCEICGHAYTCKSSLAKHMLVHDPSRPFQCTFQGCGRRFRRQVMYDAHLQSHTTSGKFPCSLCGYAFRKKHHLQRHETKVHNLTIDRNSTYSKPNTDVPMQESTSHQVSSLEGSDNFDFDSGLHNGQLVNINYEISDMGTSIVYQTLLHDEEGNQLDGQTILLPEGSHIQEVEGSRMDAQAILIQDGIQVLYQEDPQNAAEIEINSGQEIDS